MNSSRRLTHDTVVKSERHAVAALLTVLCALVIGSALTVTSGVAASWLDPDAEGATRGTQPTHATQLTI